MAKARASGARVYHPHFAKVRVRRMTLKLFANPSNYRMISTSFLKASFAK